MTPRCTNCNDTGWLRVGRVPERCGECQMMSNPTGDALALGQATPPPPVPAQAESGDVERLDHEPAMLARWLSARSASEEKHGSSLDAYRFKQAALALSLAEAVFNRTEARADRLTTAAQAARDALENVHRTLNKPNPGICCTVWLDGSPAETLSDHVEAALATLASVLDRSE